MSDRNFTYDWLQRLIGASNPESGVVNYSSYDNNGNLLVKTAARGVQTSFTYDILDRVTYKTYSGVTAPVTATSQVVYIYDSDQTIAGHPDSSEPNYYVGRLVTESNGNSTTVYRYDAQGRVQSSKQSTGGDYIFDYNTGRPGVAIARSGPRSIDWGAGRAP